MTNPNLAPNGTTTAVTTPPPRSSSSEECSNCGTKKAWVLHNVRYRTTLRRLCTSCVLRLHPASFCPVCFLTHHQNPQNTPNQHQQLVSCSNCPSLSHPDCLPPYAAFSPAPHLCPACASTAPAAFKFFNLDKTLDKRLAAVLLCAATIAVTSMSKAAAIARAEAEKKVKEAAAARKRAREALDRFVVLSSAGQTGPAAVSVSGVTALTNGDSLVKTAEEQKVKPEVKE